jgi:hypothetical protein
MEDNDKIIVFKRFENPIEASIIKAKLDAHGIPCFLTDENLANLYPLPNFTGLHVRLHLFAKDVTLAEEILNENNLTTGDRADLSEL